MDRRERDELIQRFEALQAKGLTRRQILRLGAGVLSAPALGALLAACGSGGGGGAATTATSGTSTGGAAPSPTKASGVSGTASAGTTSASGGTPGSVSSPGSASSPVGGLGGSPVAGGATGYVAPTWAPSKEIEIEYWQYTYESKVNLVNELIPKFQELNPKIKIKHVNYPYDSFRQQVQAGVQAGQGPDALNIYYGWAPAYYLAGFLQPMPTEIFPSEQVKQNFFPMVSSVAFNGKYYAIPTAVRTLGLFWNKDILAAAGFTKAPATWDELVDVAVKTTKRGSDGALQTAGKTWDPGGQDHSWWRSCLTRQNGQQPISDDNKTLYWTEPGALEAWSWFLDLNRKYKVGETGFYTDGATAFQTGNAAMHIDGSYRVGTYTAKAPDLNYAVAVLPARQAKASYASFWCNTITTKAQGERATAAAVFIDYLASPDVMRQWTPAIGELPARPAVAQDPAIMNDEKLGAFIQELEYSYADFFVDESATRQAVLDAIDRVLLQGADDKASLTEAQQTIQQGLDDYWSQVKTS